MRASWVAVSALALVTASASATERRFDEREAMADASRFAAKRNALSTRAADTRVRIQQALGWPRFYRTGDRWTVQVKHIVHSSSRKVADGHAQRDEYANPLYFSFRVLSAEQGRETAEIEVKQVDQSGNLVQSRVERVVLTVDSKLTVLSKRYEHAESGAVVSLALNGNRNVPMGFDVFPVDLPDFTTADRVTMTSGDLRFECLDMLSRKLRFQWKRGDMWPTRIDAPSGVMTLVSQEMSS